MCKAALSIPDVSISSSSFFPEPGKHSTLALFFL